MENRSDAFVSPPLGFGRRGEKKKVGALRDTTIKFHSFDFVDASVIPPLGESDKEIIN